MRSNHFLATVLPFTESGNTKLKNFNSWLRARKQIEQVDGMGSIDSDRVAPNFVECPASHDVVFRTGSNCKYHPGNSAYADLIEFYADECAKKSKASIEKETVTRIMDNIIERKGRFLEWDSTGFFWVGIENESDLRTKIYNNIYYSMKKSVARKRRQESESSTFLFERQCGKRSRLCAHNNIRGCFG